MKDCAGRMPAKRPNAEVELGAGLTTTTIYKEIEMAAASQRSTQKPQRSTRKQSLHLKPHVATRIAVQAARVAGVVRLLKLMEQGRTSDSTADELGLLREGLSDVSDKMFELCDEMLLGADAPSTEPCEACDG